MAAASFLLDRLSSLDRAFLSIEEGPLHMHVGAVAVFDGAGLVAADGALDVPALRRLLGASLEAVPRFRQHVRFLPPFGTVWTTDPHFRLDYHVRHTAIPRPGTRAQLDALAARLFSQRLDRERPLWEMWLVEGLEGGRFALVLKTHHAMLDGVAGMGLLGTLFGLQPTEPQHVAEPALSELPAEPSTGTLVAALVRRRLGSLVDVARRVRETRGGSAKVQDALRGGWSLLRGMGVSVPKATALNPLVIGPHRLFGGTRLPLDPLREVRRAWGGTLNDVALTVVTGALRRHLARQREAAAPGQVLRALVPVNLRARGAQPGVGNRVAMLLAELPVGEGDVRARHAQVCSHTARLKAESHEVEAAQLVEELGDLGPESLVGVVFDAALHLLPFHVVVTNVPGPPVPLYLGPSRLESLYPLVPLFARQSLAIGLVSYDGAYFVGINADADAVAGVDALAADLDAAYAELVQRALGTG